MANSTITRQSITQSTSISSFLNMFKEDYLPRIDDWIHNDSGPLPKMIMRKKGDMGGKKTLTAVFTSGPQGVGFTAEGYDLPTPSASTSQQPEILGKEIALRHRLTFESQMTARKTSAAFAKPRAEEMRLLREELQMRITRSLYHGPYDVLGVVSSFNGTTTMTMRARNERRYTAGLFYASGTHYFRANMGMQLIDVSNGTADITSAARGAHVLGTGGADSANGPMSVSSIGGTAAAPTVVLSSDPAAGTQSSFSADQDPAVGDFIIPFASRNDDGVGGANGLQDDAPVLDAVQAISEYHTWNGLGNINTDTTLYSALFGLAKTTTPGLLARADHNSGAQRAFTDRLVESFITNIQVNSGMEPSKLVCDPFTKLEVMKEFRNLRQFSPVIGKAGTRDLGVVMDDLTIPYVADWFCLPGLFWGVDPEVYSWYEWYPLQSPDSADVRWVNNKAQEEILLMKGGNLFCPAPWRVGVIDDISFDTTALT
jgi:hypothetical protein